jgi:peptide deformylase
MKLVTDINKLKKPIEPKPMTQQEIDEISTILLEEVTRHGGVGLAANQIGLDVRACVINVKEPLVLINPNVVEVSEEVVVYVEQCLSLPKTMKEPKKTVRHKSITIECDNLGTFLFSSDQKEPYKNSQEFFSDEGLLECVVAQHEIDHLNGILMTDERRRG